MIPEEKSRTNTEKSCTWLILTFAVLGVIVFLIPVQHYITIGRAQHHGTAIAIFGLGFWIETLLAGKSLHKWGKIAYLGTGLLFISVGAFFFKYPWIYSNVSIQTEENIQIRNILLGVYLAGITALTAIWIKWIVENSKLQSANGVESSSSEEVDSN
ncbi:MAG TPA: hypothetical protein PKD05_12200 [Candidatus Melainabacteria bacterium]|nr:hypothetical protein [Candidatus Melainabacteria bacterium]HMP52305.1 hypothetical protein [Candidatus Melainabacteria bacterium]